MAVPASAPVADQPMDPTDRVEFVAQFGEAVGELSALLEDGETIDTLEVAPAADAAALGFSILEGTVDGLDRGPWIADDVNVEFWAEVEEAERLNVAYTAGVTLGAEITFTTNLGRRYQRTVGVEVIQQ